MQFLQVVMPQGLRLEVKVLQHPQVFIGRRMPQELPRLS